MTFHQTRPKLSRLLAVKPASCRSIFRLHRWNIRATAAFDYGDVGVIAANLGIERIGLNFDGIDDLLAHPSLAGTA